MKLKFYNTGSWTRENNFADIAWLEISIASSFNLLIYSLAKHEPGPKSWGRAGVKENFKGGRGQKNFKNFIADL
jgi:hypothetical protein